MPKVWNRRDPLCPPDAVYVGRPTKWGNPFVIGKDGTRLEVIAKYKAWLAEAFDPLQAHQFVNDAIRELGGKDLVCWCAPLRCHAYVLLEIANEMPAYVCPACQSKGFEPRQGQTALGVPFDGCEFCTGDM